MINVSDRTIISFMINASANGIYAVSAKFSNILASIYQIFNMSWQESASIHINSEGKEEFFSGVLNNTYKIFFSICLLLMVGMPFVFNILIGKDYFDAKKYIPILLLSNVFSAVANVLGGIYIAKKDTKNVAKTTITSSILNIVINLVLIKFIGLYAAALSTLISCIFLYIYRLIGVKKYIKLNVEYNFIIISMIIYIISVSIYYINDFKLNIINLIMCVILVYIFNLNIIKKGVNNILKRRKK